MLITEKYPSVVATKYRLQTRIMKDDKQIWDVNCKSRVNEGKKLQVSEYVEQMNGYDNNMFFEIDEEATVAAHEANKKRAAERVEKAKGDNMTNADVLKSLAKGMEAIAGKSEKKPKKEANPLVFTFGERSSDDMSLEDLQELCKENGIKFHHKSKREKLISLIIENK
tara:strand:+ start:25 stop:528 length:504 start_codon:yes stop_codon:yes gene_type:complete